MDHLSRIMLLTTDYTLFHNSAYRFVYSVDRKSYDSQLLISYQPRRFYEFYCKGCHLTKKVLIAVWPLSGFSKKCVDEKTSVERSQSRTGNSIVRGILQVSVKISAVECKTVLHPSTKRQSISSQRIHFLFDANTVDVTEIREMTTKQI